MDLLMVGDIRIAGLHHHALQTNGTNHLHKVNQLNIYCVALSKRYHNGNSQYEIGRVTVLKKTNTVISNEFAFTIAKTMS